jgi:energy-coupling factor transport system ATP-binding protein
MPIRFEHVSHIYGKDTPNEYVGLSDLNLEFTEGKMTAIIGQTGSGKSTMVQHLNALLLPTTGTVYVLDRVIKADEKPKGLKSLRGDVGLVFQFPEYQLFEETVLKDVAFGPKNFGSTEEEAEEKAKKALKLVGFDEALYERSPLELSGGQKRRVAIAGILAMEPKVLVLDEPTAGLDPLGTRDMMRLFARLNQMGKTVLLVTHDMEQVYGYCDEVVVISEGRCLTHQKVKEFFRDSSQCEALGILPPALIQARDAFAAAGFKVDESMDTLDKLADAVARQVKHHG